MDLHVISVVYLLCLYCCHLVILVICWERADLLALVCDVKLWVCYFPIGILGQVRHLIVSIPIFALFLILNVQHFILTLSTKAARHG